MPAGTCDPASRGDTWNIGEVSYFAGRVSVRYEYGWDGTSVRPNCVGPLNRIQVVNTDPDHVYYAWFVGPRGGHRQIVIDAATRGVGDSVTPYSRVYSPAQVASAGFADSTDVTSIVITDTPDDPF